jgi:glycosyltransferase involved in cell wall biosynthesis
MRLLMLEPDPSFGGGSEAVMLSLARELARRGHQIVLLHARDGSMLDDYREFASELVQQPLPGFALRAPLRTLACVWRIGRLARRLKIDAIVSSHLGFIRHAALVRRGFGIPACFHLGLSLEPAAPTLGLGLAVAGGVGAGVAPSAHTLATWQAGGWDPRALHLVRNWVDPARFAPAVDVAALRRELGFPPRGAHLVFVGRVCRQKGIDVLVRAFPRVLAACAGELHLHIVGPVAPDFQAQLDAELQRLDDSERARIVFRPVTAHPEKYYAAADVVCAPSVGDEAFGLTVLEAMACAVPVVATSIGIIGDILGAEDAALLVAPGDCEGLAERLAFWLGHPAAGVASGARLRRRALLGYGPAPSIDRYEAIIAALAASRGGARLGA